MCELIKLKNKYKKREIPVSKWQDAATMDIEYMHKEISIIKEKMVSKDDLHKAVIELKPIKDKAAKFDLLASLFTPWYKAAAVIGFILFITAMAGQNIMQITGVIKATAPIIGG
ncbi:MAG: hypothetical protein FWG80_04505 [Alphaproteobacteria bacterium]|nr:hypothetical protein [Alphaproteobacteria bacterium]